MSRDGSRRASPQRSWEQRVEEVDDPLMQKIHYLDQLIDELPKGTKMEKILRQ